MRCKCAREHVHTHFLFLRNGLADNVQIWYAVGELETGQLICFHNSSEVPSHRSARAMHTRSFIANKASSGISKTSDAIGDGATK